MTGRAVTREATRPTLGPRHPVAAPGAKRLPGVVCHLARPDEVPQRGQCGLGLEAVARKQVGPELGATGQCLANAVVRGALSGAGAPAGLPSTDASSRKKSATRSRPDPTQTTSPVAQSWSSELRPVAGNAPGQHLGLPERDGQRQRLQRHERLAERRAAVDPVPARQEAPECRLLGRLDLLAQRGERRAAQPAEDVGVAPLALRPTRPELAADELLLALEDAELGLDVTAEVVVRLTGREGAAGARIPSDERLERVGSLSRKTSGSPDGGIAPSASRYRPASSAAIRARR